MLSILLLLYVVLCKLYQLMTTYKKAFVQVCLQLIQSYYKSNQNFLDSDLVTCSEQK